MKPSFLEMQMTHIPDVCEMMDQFNHYFSYPSNPAAKPKMLTDFLKNVSFGKIWLIQYDSKTIGYIALTYGYSFEYGGRDAFIDEFFISEQYRGLGIGTSTLQFIIEKGRELHLNALHLEVERNNQVASRLYEDLGFHISNRNLMSTSLTHSDQ